MFNLTRFPSKVAVVDKRKGRGTTIVIDWNGATWMGLTWGRSVGTSTSEWRVKDARSSVERNERMAWYAMARDHNIIPACSECVWLTMTRPTKSGLPPSSHCVNGRTHREENELHAKINIWLIFIWGGWSVAVDSDKNGNNNNIHHSLLRLRPPTTTENGLCAGMLPHNLIPGRRLWAGGRQRIFVGRPQKLIAVIDLTESQ